ncbi:hypothetical protein FJZ26_05075 [Candidatus Parvarchaeota archaeon]|nr:hypothetical protein [Candidatus Parvarchaeota archaeon]
MKPNYNFLIFLLLAGVGFAATAAVQPPSVGGGLVSGLTDLCASALTLTPIAAMLGVVCSAAIYAAGQFLGAEPRARAIVWSTTLLTGSVIAVLVQVAAPAFLSAIYGYQITCESTCNNNRPVPAGMACCTSFDGTTKSLIDLSYQICCKSQAFPGNIWTCTSGQTCKNSNPWCEGVGTCGGNPVLSGEACCGGSIIYTTGMEECCGPEDGQYWLCSSDESCSSATRSCIASG